LTFHHPLRIGEVATRTSTIRSVTEKQGRTGTLYFVDVDHEVSTAGRPAISEVQHIVYREMPSGPAVVDGPAAPDDGTFTDSWLLDSTALFRYSALTFNGHRIHYDADYARQVEGYPGLVIHGPLIATLLLDLAARNGRRVSRFRYRAVSPLFLPDSFTVNGRAEGDGVALWAASPSGRLAMSAEASVG
jgi:3-methylfumaryl-CoA hydratase